MNIKYYLWVEKSSGRASVFSQKTCEFYGKDVTDRIRINKEDRDSAFHELKSLDDSAVESMKDSLKGKGTVFSFDGPKTTNDEMKKSQRRGKAKWIYEKKNSEGPSLYVIFGYEYKRTEEKSEPTALDPNVPFAIIVYPGKSPEPNWWGALGGAGGKPSVSSFLDAKDGGWGSTKEASDESGQDLEFSGRYASFVSYDMKINYADGIITIDAISVDASVFYENMLGARDLGKLIKETLKTSKDEKTPPELKKWFGNTKRYTIPMNVVRIPGKISEDEAKNLGYGSVADFDEDNSAKKYLFRPFEDHSRGETIRVGYLEKICRVTAGEKGADPYLRDVGLCIFITFRDKFIEALKKYVKLSNAMKREKEGVGLKPGENIDDALKDVAGEVSAFVENIKKTMYEVETYSVSFMFSGDENYRNEQNPVYKSLGEDSDAKVFGEASDVLKKYMNGLEEEWIESKKYIENESGATDEGKKKILDEFMKSIERRIVSSGAMVVKRRNELKDKDIENVFIEEFNSFYEGKDSIFEQTYSKLMSMTRLASERIAKNIETSLFGVGEEKGEKKDINLDDEKVEESNKIIKAYIDGIRKYIREKMFTGKDKIMDCFDIPEVSLDNSCNLSYYYEGVEKTEDIVKVFDEIKKKKRRVIENANGNGVQNVKDAIKEGEESGIVKWKENGIGMIDSILETNDVSIRNILEWASGFIDDAKEKVERNSGKNVEELRKWISYDIVDELDSIIKKVKSEENQAEEEKSEMERVKEDNKVASQEKLVDAEPGEDDLQDFGQNL